MNFFQQNLSVYRYPLVRLSVIWTGLGSNSLGQIKKEASLKEVYVLLQEKVIITFELIKV